MQKPVAIRPDADVLEAARERARSDNRGPTACLESAPRRRVGAADPPVPAPASGPIAPEDDVRAA